LWFDGFKIFENLEFIANTALCSGYHDTEHEEYALQVRRREDKVAEFTRPFLPYRNSVVCNTDSKSHLEMTNSDKRVSL
jgi:hypothetical protein